MWLTFGTAAAWHRVCGDYLSRYAQLALSYLDVDASGAPVRRGVPEVAAMLSLPLPRAAALLQRAKRDIPLVADAEPIQVQHHARGPDRVWLHVACWQDAGRPSKCKCRQACSCHACARVHATTHIVARALECDRTAWLFASSALKLAVVLQSW